MKAGETLWTSLGFYFNFFFLFLKLEWLLSELRTLASFLPPAKYPPSSLKHILYRISVYENACGLVKLDSHNLFYLMALQRILSRKKNWLPSDAEITQLPNDQDVRWLHG